MIKKFLAETKTGDINQFSQTTKYINMAMCGAMWMMLMGIITILISDIVKVFNLSQIYSVSVAIISLTIILPIATIIFHKFVLTKIIKDYRDSE